eukprot:snap_masked-scaffold_3-processed-gene-7.3-mRNA-1 protein AED:1.00 eAED:1.00 QI:0/0/0/0/1/1/2/0/64
MFIRPLKSGARGFSEGIKEVPGDSISKNMLMTKRVQGNQRKNEVSCQDLLQTALGLEMLPNRAW